MSSPYFKKNSFQKDFPNLKKNCQTKILFFKKKKKGGKKRDMSKKRQVKLHLKICIQKKPYNQSIMYVNCMYVVIIYVITYKQCKRIITTTPSSNYSGSLVVFSSCNVYSTYTTCILHSFRVCSTSSEFTSVGQHNHTLGRQLLRRPGGANRK